MASLWRLQNSVPIKIIIISGLAWPICVVVPYLSTSRDIGRERHSDHLCSIIKYARQICQTLRELHHKGIRAPAAHGASDLKPHNIFIDEHDCALVGDLGIAKAYETTIPAGNRYSHVRGMQGPPPYTAMMSPEAFDQDAFGHVTLKTDV